MKAFSGLVCGIVAAAGCLFTMSQNGQKIAVDEPNDLGVTSLQLDRLDENGNDVFVLRGLSAANEERASVKLTRGEIPGLARLLPGDDDEGAAVEIYAGGTVSRVVTRAADVFRIETSQLEDPAASKFVPVRTSLNRVPDRPSTDSYSSSAAFCGSVGASSKTIGIERSAFTPNVLSL